MIDIERTVIDGKVAEAPEVTLAVSARYGHFTAMQVRQGRVRGLGLHLDRLDRATEELFGRPLDRGLVIDSIRSALGLDSEPEAVPDASVRVYVCEVAQLHVLVTATAPVEIATTPQSLRSVRYQRFLPHIKHTGGFPQGYLGRRVEAEGFDEALLTTDDGVISEGSITNLGCFDGNRVIWPDAPMLHGITMQLMEAGLTRAGVPYESRVLRVADLRDFPVVFLTNSRGVVPVGRVDDMTLKVDETAAGRLIGYFEGMPWDDIHLQ
ncbi:aminotransferase class IV [Nonomuraea guangzhouensis]|uniref:Aminotransferase class IV n=1 Tax=Nonomuraea guangzhouensis TaxID=1291555 RepID=A0ABW4GD56_9ACTN|nr:aminotransferase class IV [Nonomuraea guangzhouensis]